MKTGVAVETVETIKIGPKNTTLTAEIADGWLPTLFSPEHVGEFRPLLEKGFARAGGDKGFDDFDIVPTVTAMVSDDREAARDAMRHYVALYVGGMGSRKQNFYNALVRRYGFEDAAEKVQSLYLEGRKGECKVAGFSQIANSFVFLKLLEASPAPEVRVQR